MTATTTTIRDVSIFSRQRRRKADVFDIALSSGGIVIRRPGRVEQFMAWDRISQWELEERSGCVLLTLRGSGSVTPLVVKGWTVDDLETVLREVTEGTTAPDVPSKTEPVQPRAARRKANRRRGTWKVLVTAVLLGLLATAVTLVLLQSAGIISWGFLGPTA